MYLLKGTRFYLGITGNIKIRYQQHLDGKVYSTKRMGNDLKLVGYLECENKKIALKIESNLKKSGHIDRIMNYEGFVKC
ncbi:MAG TPA: GIY-YIG nuclease family protein [Candidatus Absconditabacterales bacterium]|nr:GIY-YIG nuclease family protein [Candidatus Absconditabacterales bacterium]